MNKTLLNIIASISILTSLITYLNSYSAMLNSSTSSKGWGEYFTLISSLLFILGGICLTTILKNTSKPMLYFSLIIYFLIGIIPIAIGNQLTLIPTGIVSIITMLVTIKFVTSASQKQLLKYNGLILFLNYIWSMMIWI